MDETFYQRCARIEREKWRLLSTLREIVEIEERRCKQEHRVPPRWLDEAKALLAELED
jgi:hypothetical protein